MTTVEVEFHDPSPLDTVTIDRNGIRRSKDGRPYVKVRCSRAAAPEGRKFASNHGVSEALAECVDGRIPGKRPGITKKCPKCDGETGWKDTLYSRCTSFVGALEDRQNLEAWQKRIVLLGLAADYHSTQRPLGHPSLLARIRETDPEDAATLDALADEAYRLGDGYRAAQKGTDLHALTELVDSDSPLPDDGSVSLEDRRDLAAYVRVCEEYGIEHLDMERFVVHDGLKIAGTYDRRVQSWDPRLRCMMCDGQEWDSTVGGETLRLLTHSKPKVLDLKTGRIDYGAGKMAQQLAVYANASAYDPETGERSEQDVCPHVGFILHLPQGTGTASLHRLDLVKGWEAVQLSALVREHRRISRDWIEPVS